MLNKLPDDIILHIISFTNNPRLLNTTLLLSDDIHSEFKAKIEKAKYRLVL